MVSVIFFLFTIVSCKTKTWFHEFFVEHILKITVLALLLLTDVALNPVHVAVPPRYFLNTGDPNWVNNPILYKKTPIEVSITQI
ncbi:MAG: hypothetical protein M3O71_29975 [Bacteroidota bacterium]|nr:hypothetical protein [Bacteroidota bacterium]